MIITRLACFELSLLSRHKTSFPGRGMPGPRSPACPPEFPGPGQAPVRGG
jgi:hypothetical protein